MTLDGSIIDVNLQEVDDTGDSGLYREVEFDFEKAHRDAVRAAEYLNKLFLTPSKPSFITRIYNYLRRK